MALRALVLREEETLILVRDRVNVGLDTRLELKQSEGSLPETRQQIEALLEQQALAQNALAALISQLNSHQVPVNAQLLAIKNVVTPTSLPADLLGRRGPLTPVGSSLSLIPSPFFLHFFEKPRNTAVNTTSVSTLSPTTPSSARKTGLIMVGHRAGRMRGRARTDMLG